MYCISRLTILKLLKYSLNNQSVIRKDEDETGQKYEQIFWSVLIFNDLEIWARLIINLPMILDRTNLTVPNLTVPSEW